MEEESIARSEPPTKTDSNREWNSAKWLEHGMLLGRVEEAARRDVAPSVVLIQLRTAERVIAESPDAVKSAVGNLIGTVENAVEPSVVLKAVLKTQRKLAAIAVIPARDEQLSDGAEAALWLGAWETTYGRWF